ncbi:MAG: DUF885 domain-containing protein [Acidobacteriaceae bacterium]|nr:DUF885 domain-containing protein [Acidobacteriaceae bacterium]
MIRKLLGTALLTGALAMTGSEPSASIGKNIAAQNQLFEQYYEQMLKDSPELATTFGDLRYNDLLDDRSLAAIERQHIQRDAFLARLHAIPTQGMPEVDRLSHAILERNLTNEDTDYDLKSYELPLRTLFGIDTTLADLPQSVPFDSLKEYEDYIHRLHQIPRAFDQTIGILRAGIREGVTQPKIVVSRIQVRCEGIAAASPFLSPTTRYPSAISAADRKKLTEEITKAANDEVLPAYRRFATFLKVEYIPHAQESISIESLPRGKERYAFAVRKLTSLNLSPEQVHELGLREVERINGEIEDLAHKAGYPSSEKFGASIDPAPWQATSADQVLNDFRKHIAQMQSKLPELFTVFPTIPVTVEAAPSYDKSSQTHYLPGTPDGKVPGRVIVQMLDPARGSLLGDEAVAYHEGIPGHHLQFSIQEQIHGIPKFRLRPSEDEFAFVEGWGLYAEQLGKEVGFYRDAPSDLSRLESELFRAVRLVVDTGIHHSGWTREQAIAYMNKTLGGDDPNDPFVTLEVDRYISWPGQALAYKTGELEILKLREDAKARLGPNFDLRAFHDEILAAGSLPLDLLDSRIHTWIQTQQTPLTNHKPTN